MRNIINVWSVCAEKQIISFARLAFCSLKKITASVLRIHWRLGKELRFFSIFLSSPLKGNIARRLMTSYSLAKRRTYVFCTLREVPLRYFYRPRDGNVFTSVCQEFCPRGEGGRLDISACNRQTTHRQTPPRQTPPTQANTSLHQDGHWSGRYASYWNAFL